jgi:hypothetical protein
MARRRRQQRLHIPLTLRRFFSTHDSPANLGRASAIVSDINQRPYRTFHSIVIASRRRSPKLMQDAVKLSQALL